MKRYFSLLFIMAMLPGFQVAFGQSLSEPRSEVEPEIIGGVIEDFYRYLSHWRGAHGESLGPPPGTSSGVLRARSSDRTIAVFFPGQGGAYRIAPFIQILFSGRGPCSTLDGFSSAIRFEPTPDNRSLTSVSLIAVPQQKNGSWDPAYMSPARERTLHFSLEAVRRAFEAWRIRDLSNADSWLQYAYEHCMPPESTARSTFGNLTRSLDRFGWIPACSGP